MHSKTSLALLAVLVVLVVPPSTLAAVPAYSAPKIEARSNIIDGFNLPATSSFNSKTPALNDDATIAFALVSVGGGPAGLFVGSAGSGSVVYDAPVDRQLGDPSIDSAGCVAFDQSDIFSEGIFVYDPADGQTMLEVAPLTFNFVAHPGITDDGAIGFRSGLLAGAQTWRVDDSGASTLYVAEGAGIAYLFTPTTNNTREIAGKVRLGSTAGSSPDEIRVYDGPASFVTVAEDDDGDPLSPYVGFDNSVDLTDDGHVAFIADLVAGGRGVFLTDGTTTVTIATTADPLVSAVSFFPPAASESGLVVFRGTDGGGLDAIFVGDGADLVRVVAEHDLVGIDLGSARIDQHDSSVVFGGSVAINARGDIAFNAALTPKDNDQVEWGSGMFVARVVTAPPPVPDGDAQGGSPLLLARHANGIDLVVSWDTTTCPGDETNLFFGDLAEVATVALAGAECSLGTTGTAVIAPPVGDVFFLMATENTDGVESGHGLASSGAARPSNGIGLCGIVGQSLEGTCPQP